MHAAQGRLEDHAADEELAVLSRGWRDGYLVAAPLQAVAFPDSLGDRRPAPVFSRVGHRAVAAPPCPDCFGRAPVLADEKERILDSLSLRFCFHPKRAPEAI